LANASSPPRGRRECPGCGSSYELFGAEPACVCGNPLSWVEEGAAADPGSSTGIWRYADLLPPVSVQNRLSLGEETTPLVAFGELSCKLDYLLPSGSVKDRGAAVLASCALEARAAEAAADSSGNAGSALAAYFAAGGIPLTVFVPAGASSPKVAQTRRYGADVREVDGDRAAASEAARSFAAERGAFYASHAWSPFFPAGMRTLAAELVSQLGADVPAVVAPVGAGTLLLGVHQGFARLEARGLVKAPALFGVQAAACAPLADAFAEAREDVDPARSWGRSIAEGINIAQPPRASEILKAVRSSGGAIVTVEEAEILVAQGDLARRGILTEATSAAAVAGARRLGPRLPTGAVVVLTGFGLKEAS
jgi:threonine synthase